jgi:hypothetical protein
MTVREAGRRGAAVRNRQVATADPLERLRLVQPALEAHDPGLRLQRIEAALQTATGARRRELLARQRRAGRVLRALAAAARREGMVARDVLTAPDRLLAPVVRAANAACRGGSRGGPCSRRLSVEARRRVAELLKGRRI